MLNRRLQTQPLDPSVLSTLGVPSDPTTASQPARPTAPLQTPGSLLDNFGNSNKSRLSGELPAQTPAVSSALNTRLNEKEAELLLDVSERLASIRQNDPAQFQVIMSALQELSAGQDGQVNFSALSTQQQQALTGLGMTPQNTRVIFQQLYHMLLPTGQQNSSEAFKTVQASVTSFISNLDLREQTMNQIQQQAKDLSAVQGVVSNLAANSIEALLADQTNSVYDTGLSRINSQNFQINNGMDYTIGHFVVLSQRSPQALQQVEGLIEKVKSDQVLQPQERNVLSQYGLQLNPQNKLQTIDGQVLDFNSVKRLEDVIYSMKDPSEGYLKVLQSSADVIRKSGQLEQIAALATRQNQQVQNTTHTVLVQTQQLQQLQTDANQLDSQLKGAQYKADHLVDAIGSISAVSPASNLGSLSAPATITPASNDALLDLNPAFLQQWNIQIQARGGQLHFFVQGQEVTRLQMMQHLGQLLQQQRNEISQMSTELANKKTAAQQANVTLNQTTQQLETQSQDLAKTQNALTQGKAELDAMVKAHEALVAKVKPQLSPEELKMVETEIEPATQKASEQALKDATEVAAQIEVTLTKAHTTIQASHLLQDKVAEDIKLWELTLKESDRSLGRIKQAEAEIQHALQVEQETAPPALEAKHKETEQVQEQAQIAQNADLGPDKELEAQELKLKQKRQEQAQAEKAIEAAYQSQTHEAKRFDEQMETNRQSREQSQKDRQRLQSEVQELLDQSSPA